MAIGEHTHQSPHETKATSDPDLDLRILRALRRIIRAVGIHSKRLASQYKITSPQLVTLLCIVNEGPITPSRIARDVHLDNSTIVGILDRLEAKGLVLRERSTVDRRHVYVSATSKGIALVNDAPLPLQDVFSEALHKLPELEQMAIALSLERIVELMEAKDIDAAPMLQEGDIGDTDSPSEPVGL